MSATAPKTVPPQAAPRDLDEEQRALTIALMNHPDPYIRLTAHMSERQMALVELIGEFRHTLESNTSAVSDLSRQVEKLSARQDTHERRYPLNGQGEHADADAE